MDSLMMKMTGIVVKTMYKYILAERKQELNKFQKIGKVYLLHYTPIF